MPELLNKKRFNSAVNKQDMAIEKFPIHFLWWVILVPTNYVLVVNIITVVLSILIVVKALHYQ